MLPRRKPMRAITAITAVVVAAIVAAVVLVVVRPSGGRIDDSATLAHGAEVSASSTALGYAAQSAVLGPTAMPSRGWRSDGQTIGAWIEISWPEAHELRSITIERPAGSEAAVTAGALSFGDGSGVQVVLATGSRTTTVPLTPRSARSVRFTATGFAAGATATTIERFAVNASDTVAVADPHGDAAAVADVSASSGGDASRLVRGGEGWRTDSPAGATIRFAWSAPREIVSISIAGAAGSSATISSATLRFDGGGSVPIGAVPADPSLPTKIAFLPFVTTGATLVIRSVAGTGPLALVAVGLTERGTDAAAERGDEGTSVSARPAGSCDDVAAPASTSTLQVLCPENGARTGDSVTLVVSMPPGANGVTVDVWPASGDASAAPVTVSGTGAVRVPLRLAALPEGPLTARVRADGVQGQSVLFQLLHGEDRAEPAERTTASRGRTLVYDEEFDGPVSASRSGEGMRYTSAKPETGSVSDFGSAIFSDPSDGLGNVGTLDDRYLRLAVSPKPTAYPDPLGWGRTSIGGMLASARPGGSGFSAQYGYFEARMLAPAVPGTWPAFWLLPSNNLVTPQEAVAEIDAVELYGHDPQAACQTTHEYLDGEDGGVAACGQRFASARSASQWHVYGVDVTPTRIMFFIDGKRVAASPQVRGGGDPMFFLVDLALGGGWPVQLSGTGGRAQLLVDSIRVYV